MDFGDNLEPDLYEETVQALVADVDVDVIDDGRISSKGGVWTMYKSLLL